MDQESASTSPEILYPMIFIPKTCTKLESNFEVTDNVFIDLNISTSDTDGNKMCLYSGLCNIKLIDSYNVNIQKVESPNGKETLEFVEDNPVPVIVTEPGGQVSDYPTYTQSQVWIDPARSPYVYNHFDATESMEHYSVYQTAANQITFEQHNTYITQNVYNYMEPMLPDEVDNKKFKNVQAHETNKDSEVNGTDFCLRYEEDELECGVFLSHLPEEIMNEKECKAREERRYIGLQSENIALEQLMSSDVQSASKQRKTILFLGQNAQYGQTIQKIAMNNPMLECSVGGEVDHEVIIENNEESQLYQKKYQCDTCEQIFHHITDFKQHMVGVHKSPRKPIARDTAKDYVNFYCAQCNKTLKDRNKFRQHCMAHGNPELECSMCKKVFVSKFTLRTHRKIHFREKKCRYCTKSFADLKRLRAHLEKIHLRYMCDVCEYITEQYCDLMVHQQTHDKRSDDMPESILDEVMSVKEMPSPEECFSPENENDFCLDDMEDTDAVLAKVMSNKILFQHSKSGRKRWLRKTCNICLKKFDRVSDLKRHLIEHVVKCTLAKSPVNDDGTLNIRCEVCHAEPFTDVSRYKAHLREHAKLTLYQCTFCDKSFSDSSNFSKHKKIHGSTYMQCDLCLRKFNSKKMLIQHMEHHNKNAPLTCHHCGKLFHFESMLNKHIKCVHTNKVEVKYKCRFCDGYLSTLKEKWDHEWFVHNVRKMIVDCLICGCKFRKYAELKKHCSEAHDLGIPKAKKLLGKKIKVL